MIKLKYIKRIPAILYCVLIVFLSNQSRLPAIFYKTSDKVEHLVEYFILALLVYFGWGFFRKTRNKILLLLVLFGVADELHQLFIPGRVASVSDALADTAGVIIAYFFLKVQTDKNIYWYNFSGRDNKTRN